MSQRIFFIITTIIFLIVVSCSYESNLIVNHQTSINKTYDEWVESTNAKDINRWSSFIAPDAVFLPPASNSLESVEEIKNYYINLFQDPNFKLECNQVYVEISESEDMAWSRGVCKATFSSPDGTVGKGSSKWTKVWVRMSDGSWKCKLNTWNNN